MKEQESFFDRFTPVRRMQIFAGILLVAAVALLLAALEREPEHAPDRIYDMAGLYRITVPGKMNTLLFGETSILFSGDYSAPDVMMIVDPEKEPSGEFLPVDRNRAELKSMLLETLGVADIVPEGLEVGRVGEFEFSMLPGVEFDFTFKGHCGIGYLCPRLFVYQRDLLETGAGRFRTSRAAQTEQSAAAGRLPQHSFEASGD